MHLGGSPRIVSSVLARVEVARGALRKTADGVELAEATLSKVAIIEMTDAIIASASTMKPVLLRSLDAIHVATALSLGSELDAVVTYDGRMAEAATAAGLRVVAPA